MKVDLIRGILIILVVIDHIFWNLKHYGGIWYDLSNENNFIFRFFPRLFLVGIGPQAPERVIQPIILMQFLLYFGISCAFSRDNWKRAIQNPYSLALFRKPQQISLNSFRFLPKSRNGKN